MNGGLAFGAGMSLHEKTDSDVIFDTNDNHQLPQISKSTKKQDSMPVMETSLVEHRHKEER
jgi:hypothetical protein